MSDDRKVPEGRLGRLARLAQVGLRTGASVLAGGDGLPSARHAAEVLGTLRGVAAKVGQLASYVDGVVPEAHRDAYQTALRGLRAAAPSSSAGEVRALLERELGAPREELFAVWDEAPVASASIGQVHRAVLQDGREVAVKVQHPGIVAALESDLANAAVVEQLLGIAGGRRLNSRALLETVKERFREELDYDLEARRQRHFLAVHAGDPAVRIPRVVDERSSARVLTQDFVRGRTFEEACEAPTALREVWARTLWRFVFRGNLVGRMFNADPHPGNYLFHDDGGVTFLDFGCVQEIPEEAQARALRAHRAALARDEGAFRRSMQELLRTRPGSLEPLALDFVRRCFEPLFASPYRIRRPWAAELVEGVRAMTLVARKLPDAELFTMPPEMLFMNRLQFGFYSVLARLDVEADYAAEERRFLDDAGL
jgi:predicted unusual protein kinase regulating ubiquinone biosynthesis (AarF/ABC1/UbiB family)